MARNKSRSIDRAELESLAMKAICFCDACGVYHDATHSHLQAAHASI